MNIQNIFAMIGATIVIGAIAWLVSTFLGAIIFWISHPDTDPDDGFMYWFCSIILSITIGILFAYTILL